MLLPEMIFLEKNLTPYTRQKNMHIISIYKQNSKQFESVSLKKMLVPVI